MYGKIRKDRIKNERILENKKWENSGELKGHITRRKIKKHSFEIVWACATHVKNGDGEDKFFYAGWWALEEKG